MGLVGSLAEMARWALPGHDLWLDMHPLAATGCVSRQQKRIALAIAAIADLLQLGLFPVFGEGVLSIPDDALDAVVALLLVLTLGWRWRILAALAIELVPGVAAFPTWTAFVLMVKSEEAAPAIGLDRGEPDVTPRPQ
jgi:hypothetical protein